MSKDIRWLFASDIHFPRHDSRMLELWFQVLKYMKPQAVDLLGDIDDADGTGRWAEGTSREGFSLDDAGITGTRQLLKDIHRVVPKADKHFHDGNHGWTRHKKYLDKNFPASLKDEVYTPEVLYEYQKAGFVWHEYDQPPVRRYGDIFAHHGESISKHAGESVRNDVEKWGVSVIRGHSHRQGEYFKSFPLDGRTVRGYEIGHMCDAKKMDYIINPDWQAGFAYGIVHGDQVFVDTVEIHDYTCFVGGRLFKG